VIKRIAPQVDFHEIPSVSIFSMNGPHFGDRYGIVSELMGSLVRRQVQLLALSCTIASISGVVPRSQFEFALEAIQEHFEVPSVTRREE
jgi:aspartokinase